MLIFFKIASPLTTLSKNPQIIIEILQKAPQKIAYTLRQLHAVKYCIILVYASSLLL